MPELSHVQPDNELPAGIQAQRFRQRYNLIALLISLIIITTSWMLQANLFHRYEAEARQELLERAQLAATLLNRGDLEILLQQSGCNPPSGPARTPFAEINWHLQRVRLSQPDIKCVYLVAVRNGQVQLLAISAPENPSEYQPPGYQTAALQIKEALLTGRPEVAVRLGDSRVFSLVPVRGSNSRVLCLLGIDLDSKAWPKAPAPYRSPAAAITIVALLFLFASLRYRHQVLDRRAVYLATHDPLTNLPNRQALAAKLNTIRYHTTQVQNCLLLIDIDNFQLVNDTMLHGVGDRVLVKLSRFIRRKLDRSGFLARMGGDEFAILLEGASLDQARTTAEMLRREVERTTFRIDDFAVELTISIGVAETDPLLDVHEALSLADTALCQAKERGKNQVAHCEYPTRLTISGLSQTRQTISLIKEALRQERFVAHFQPIKEITGKLVSYELLLRMSDPSSDRLIYPGDFIPVAEHYGLSPEIDHWVLRAAIKALQEHHEIKVFINLSPTCISNPRLGEKMFEEILSSGIEPWRIGFEITETAALKDLKQTLGWIEKFRSAGCKFALDDFGTEYSTFSSLQKLPLDYLKIDGSFITSIDENGTGSIIQAMTTMAHALGMKTIAEWVENDRTMKKLEGMGVDCCQGFYLGKPGPLQPSLNR